MYFSNLPRRLLYFNKASVYHLCILSTCFSPGLKAQETSMNNLFRQTPIAHCLEPIAYRLFFIDLTSLEQSTIFFVCVPTDGNL